MPLAIASQTHAAAATNQSNAPLLLVIHGLTSSHRTFAAVVDRFTVLGDVVTVDLPGYCESFFSAQVTDALLRASGDAASRAQVVAACEAVVATHDPEASRKVLILGHSAGGKVAVLLAARALFRSRIAAVVVEDMDMGHFDRVPVDDTLVARLAPFRDGFESREALSEAMLIMGSREPVFPVALYGAIDRYLTDATPFLRRAVVVDDSSNHALVDVTGLGGAPGCVSSELLPAGAAPDSARWVITQNLRTDVFLYNTVLASPAFCGSQGVAPAERAVEGPSLWTDLRVPLLVTVADEMTYCDRDELDWMRRAAEGRFKLETWHLPGSHHSQHKSHPTEFVGKCLEFFRAHLDVA